ncbi:AbfB domain-containing protein [Quadrisphaera oryzae]|uniref:AbfB domain-containing protein n=1 Tax=Quadrisphaera TaxID=317661 RepID=UPI001646B8CA|nr:AbfB domain-containing protein [Quadrisphaera sp. RL12-1S]MBC3761451.1 AbfB domain-containing protein [Quadrisphaera sp. RL12-1S]
MTSHLGRVRHRRLAALAAAATLCASLLGASTTASAPPAQAATGDAAYVMTYFKESPNGSGNSNNVHLAVSKDGLEWTALNDNKPILDPTAGTGGIRDPYLLRLQDGTWAIFATDLAPGVDFARPNPNIHMWTSPDLVNWSADRLISINGANPDSYTWAPAVFWDASRSQYAVTYSAHPAGGPNGVIMAVYTSDFQTFTSPVRFFDNGGRGGVIDSAVITGVGGTNYLYYRSDPVGGLAGARSSSLAPGSFTEYSVPPKAAGCVEAPTPVQSLSNPSTWWLWGDNYCPNNKFEVWQGDIASGTWSLKSKRDFTAPLGSKHNDVKTITQAQYDGLLSRFGGTSSTRLKSSNYPERYVRHANFRGRIDELPFDPQSDAQFRQVTGLTGSGVSFEAVGFPGQYLTNSGGSVVLAAPDGTARSRSDATFTAVSGLADASWTSYRSSSDPSLYLRHSGFELKVTTIANATDRADATFRAVP